VASFWFDHAWLASGWARHVRVTTAGGSITSVTAATAARPDDARHAIALPGLPNLHSHAFQHAMAGLAERAGAEGQDDFWTWRHLMYDQVNRLAPDQLQAIAAMAQIEMLEAGFTRVGEFHYVHHQPDGSAYDAPAEMAAAIAAAASETGIGLTLLPVFYAHAGFAGAPPLPGQRRFITDLDFFARLLDESRRALAGLDGAVLGVAPHSLRAVTLPELATVAGLLPGAPVHIHIAEQTGEVSDCLAWSGQRPVALLCDSVPVDPRWCLVHATHVEAYELAQMAASGAVVGLCPITEANLGDGLFPATEWRKLGGRYGIGSDSNVRIDAAEELRLLEYGQRLQRRQRNIICSTGSSTGATLFAAALAGGAQALGVSGAGLVPGAPADFITLRADHPGIAGDMLLDRWIFTRGTDAIDGVWRGGRQLVADGRHAARDALSARHAAAIRSLLDG
jgi:formimidoylglutamate deiminase